MRNEKLKFLNVCLSLALFALLLSQSACDSATQPLVTDLAQSDSDKDVASVLPASSEEAKAIAEAADINNAIGQARWDNEIQEAVRDLNDPFNLPRRADGNNPLPGGMENPNPNPPVPEDPVNNDEAAEEPRPAPIDRYQRERADCQQNAEEHHSKWDRVSNQCICDDGQGYYNFATQQGNLLCRRSIERLILDFQVSHHSGNNVGTDSDIKISICPDSNSPNFAMHWSRGMSCRDYIFSTEGRKFDKGFFNRILINFGQFNVLPLEGLGHIFVTLMGRDGVYLNSIEVAASDYEGPVAERTPIFGGEESNLNAFDDLIALPAGRGFRSIYEHGCVNSWLDDTNNRETIRLDMAGGLGVKQCGNDRNDEGEIHWY